VILQDLALLDKARTGDKFAFKQIVIRYEKKMANIIKGMLGNVLEAEDIAQQTFIRFYKSLHNFKGDSKLSTYLARIAINLTLNEIRKRGRWSILDVNCLPSEYLQLREEEPDTFEYTAIHRAVLELKPKFRSVVVLKYMQGLSTEEIARCLDIPAGTVLSRTQRAHQKLKMKLKPIREVAHGLG